MTMEEDRKKCWAARDLYLACLSENSTPNDLYEALKTDQSQIIPLNICQELRAAMYSSCPESWVIFAFLLLYLLYRQCILKRNLEVNSYGLCRRVN